MAFEKDTEIFTEVFLSLKKWSTGKMILSVLIN